MPPVPSAPAMPAGAALRAGGPCPRASGWGAPPPPVEQRPQSPRVPKPCPGLFRPLRAQPVAQGREGPWLPVPWLPRRSEGPERSWVTLCSPRRDGVCATSPLMDRRPRPRPGWGLGGPSVSRATLPAGTCGGHPGHSRWGRLHSQLPLPGMGSLQELRRRPRPWPPLLVSKESGYCSRDTVPTRSPCPSESLLQRQGASRPGPVRPAAWAGGVPRRGWQPRQQQLLTAGHREQRVAGTGRCGSQRGPGRAEGG